MNQFLKWAAEMDRAASAVEDESDGSVECMAIIDGNRAIAEVLRHGASIEAKMAALVEIHPFHQWGEDDGDVIWHLLPVREPPFHCGRPTDSDWPWDDSDMEDAAFTSLLGWSKIPPVNENVAAKVQP